MTIAVSVLTIVQILIFLVVKPSLTIRGKSISFYWIIALAGAISLVAIGGITPVEAWEGLTRDTSVNPLKLLVIFFGMTFLARLVLGIPLSKLETGANSFLGFQGLCLDFGDGLRYNETTRRRGAGSLRSPLRSARHRRNQTIGG